MDESFGNTAQDRQTIRRLVRGGKLGDMDVGITVFDGNADCAPAFFEVSDAESTFGRLLDGHGWSMEAAQVRFG